MSHVLPPHVQHGLGRKLALRVGHAGAAGSKKREPHAGHARFVLGGIDRGHGDRGTSGGGVREYLKKQIESVHRDQPTTSTKFTFTMVSTNTTMPKHHKQPTAAMAAPPSTPTTTHAVCVGLLPQGRQCVLRRREAVDQGHHIAVPHPRRIQSPLHRQKGLIVIRDRSGRRGGIHTSHRKRVYCTL